MVPNIAKKIIIYVTIPFGKDHVISILMAYAYRTLPYMRIRINRIYFISILNIMEYDGSVLYSLKFVGVNAKIIHGAKNTKIIISSNSGLKICEPNKESIAMQINTNPISVVIEYIKDIIMDDESFII